MSAAVQHSRLGDFELIAKVGEGGMGAVYKARQISLDRIVALKVLPRRLAQDEQYLGRFVREARAMARLNHRNIVAGFDVNFSDGYNYVVMEFVDGWTVRDWIKQKGCVPERDALQIGLAMTAALTHAHDAGIIHRDVKPENIIIASDGTPKLTDLGLSKGKEADDSHLTQSGAVVGTAYYIAPEQARGEAIDGRADIYALGCTLYHAATGKTPFEAASPAVLMLKHISEKMRHPQSVRPELSDEFCALLAYMVARDPADRYATPAEVARDIEALLNGQPQSREPLTSSAANFLPPPKASGAGSRNSEKVLSTAARIPIKKNAPAVQNSRQSRTHPKPRKQGPLLIIAGITSIVMLGLAALLLHSKFSEPAVSSVTVTSTTTSTSTSAVSGSSVSTVTNAEKAPGPPVGKVSRAEMRVPNPGNLERPSVPVVSWLNGRNFDDWTGVTEHWKMINGVMVGTGDATGSTQINKRGLPANFELIMTLSVNGTYHFGWSTSQQETSNFFERNFDGSSTITRYSCDSSGNCTSTDLAHGNFNFSASKHTLRIVVYDTRMKVFVDGRQLVSAGGLTAQKSGTRLFYLYAHSHSTLEIQSIGARELMSSEEFELSVEQP
jgi:serine/threonine protein kinase